MYAKVRKMAQGLREGQIVEVLGQTPVGFDVKTSTGRVVKEVPPKAIVVGQGMFSVSDNYGPYKKGEPVCLFVDHGTDLKQVVSLRGKRHPVPSKLLVRMV